MKEELWLKKIKERLDDYSEELPSDGWQRLEEALEKERVLLPPQLKHTRTVMLRRWSVAAAAAILVGVSAVGFWLLGSPTAEEAVRLAQTPEVETPLQEAVPLVGQPLQARSYEGEKRLATTAMAATATVTKSRPVLSRSVPQLDDSVKVSTFSSSEGSQKADVKSQPRPRRKTSLDTPAVLPEHPIDKRNRKGWSLALAVGGHGTATNGNGSSASLMSDAITGVLLNTVPTANINLSAMTDGVISIPEGQSLAFREGKPYLMNRTRTVVSVDHRQPVSVGFSVRKELGKGFSVETGLMYTFLSSDLRFEDSSEELSQKLHYLGIPLRANWNFVDTRLFTLYLSAGGAVEKCVYGKLGSDDLSQRPWQFSVLGAVGVQYNLSKRVGIYAEPGVSYYFDDASSLQTLRKEHPCSFTLQAGLRLTY